MSGNWKTGRGALLRFPTFPCVFSILSVMMFNASADDLESALQARSERVLLEESIAAEQSAAEARNDSGTGLELRPAYSKDDIALALRVYLPRLWSRGKLNEQLNLVAESETLRVDALEWQELLGVCREFCTYRMLRKQRELLDDEIHAFAAQIDAVDVAVRQHQFAAAERAKLTGQYLELLNSMDRIDMERLDVVQNLHRSLGTAVDLDALAETVRIALPSRLDVNELVAQALENRADYRRLGVEAESLKTAAALARAEDGFHFKHIQSSYRRDPSGDDGGQWGISAAFTLPWGNRNPDVDVYRRKQELMLSAMALQQRRIKERLGSLIQVSTALSEQIQRRSERIGPLIKQLGEDLGQLEAAPLSQLRDRMLIRERILDTALQTARMECVRDRITLDLVEEIGTRNP